MAKKTKEPTKPDYSQDKADLAKMLQFYADQFGEVYSLTCLNCNRIIAVEVAPVRADGVVLEKGRTLYTYSDLCLSVRRRIDVNANGDPMYGYQCVCGNNTILAKVEKGEVAERTVLVNAGGDIVADTGAIPSSSPYEQHIQQATVRLKAASTKADYETDGTVERYETFKLERVK